MTRKGNRPLKILMVLMGLEIGGAETHVAELAMELARRGHQVHIASNGGVYEKEIVTYNIKHHKLPLHTKRPDCIIKSYVGLKNIIRDNDFDIVHAHARIPGFICGILHKKLKFRFITTAHWVFKTGIMLKHITNWGERSIAVSNDIKKYLIDNYKYPDNKIDVTINGIDTNKFSASIDYSDVAEEFGLTEGKTRIVYVSRMDIDRSAVAFNLLNVTPMLYEKYPNIEVVIVGGGNDYNRLVSKVEEVNSLLERKVAIATNGRTDINKFVASGDMFIGVSRAALEAMSAEKPVIIAGNEGYIGVFEQDKIDVCIKTNFCCRGCEMPSDEILYRDICGILDSKNIKEMGDFNRRFIIDNYSVARMVNDYENAYAKLLVKNPFRKNDVLISGYYGYKNIGDDSLLKSIVQNLREQKPDVSITVLSKKPKETAVLYNVKSIYRYNIFKILSVLKHTRLLVSGGGSLLQDVTSTHSYKYYSSIMKMALRYGTKVMVYANGIGPIVAEKNRIDCKNLLDRVHKITLRDEQSLQELKSMGVQNEITVSADPAFSLNSSNLGFKENESYFVVSVRKWKGLPNDFADKLGAVCREIHEKYNIIPVFVPMQSWMDTDLSVEIAAKCGGKVAPAFVNAENLIEYIKNSQFVLGMRLHSLIYSLSANVPLVALSYDPKVDAIVHKWDCCKAFDVKSIDVSDMVSQLEYVIENRDFLKEEIAKTTKLMKEKNIRDAKVAVELMEF